MWLISENKQIGIVFILTGFAFYFLGLLLVFNQAFLILGNVFFRTYNS